MWVSDDAVSTTEGPEYEKWKVKGGFIGRLWVPRVPLRWLLYDDRGTFDFVSIDTEGTSVDLCKEMIRMEYLPLCVSVEHNSRNQELMTHAGPYYACVYENDTNLVLKRR